MDRIKKIEVLTETHDEVYDLEDGVNDYLNDETFNDIDLVEWDEDWHERNAELAKLNDEDYYSKHTDVEKIIKNVTSFVLDDEEKIDVSKSYNFCSNIKPQPQNIPHPSFGFNSTTNKNFEKIDIDDPAIINSLIELHPSSMDGLSDSTMKSPNLIQIDALFKSFSPIPNETNTGWPTIKENSSVTQNKISNTFFPSNNVTPNAIRHLNTFEVGSVDLINHLFSGLLTPESMHSGAQQSQPITPKIQSPYNTGSSFPTPLFNKPQYPTDRIDRRNHKDNSETIPKMSHLNKQNHKFSYYNSTVPTFTKLKPIIDKSNISSDQNYTANKDSSHPQNEKQCRSTDDNSQSTHTEEDCYAGLMGKKDKALILKIQLVQLQCEDPFTQDYYYTVSMMKHILAKETDVAFPYPHQIIYPTTHVSRKSCDSNDSPAFCTTPSYQASRPILTPTLLLQQPLKIDSVPESKLIFDISKFIVPSKHVDIFVKRHHTSFDKPIDENDDFLPLEPTPLKDGISNSPNKKLESKSVNEQKLELNLKSINYLLENKTSLKPAFTRPAKSTEEVIIAEKDGHLNKPKRPGKLVIPPNNDKNLTKAQDVIVKDGKNGLPLPGKKFGKTSHSSIYTPHLLLEISFNKNLNIISQNNTDVEAQNNITNYRQLLLFIENMYVSLLEFDDPQTKIIALSQRDIPSPISLSHLPPVLNRENCLKALKIYQRVFPTYKASDFEKEIVLQAKNGDDIASLGNTEIAGIGSESVQLMQILCINKGRILLSRLVPYLDQITITYLLTRIFKYLNYFINWDFDDGVSAKLIKSFSRYYNDIGTDVKALYIMNIISTLWLNTYQQPNVNDSERSNLTKESILNKFTLSLQLIVITNAYKCQELRSQEILKKTCMRFVGTLLLIHGDSRGANFSGLEYLYANILQFTEAYLPTLQSIFLEYGPGTGASGAESLTECFNYFFIP